MPLLACGLLGLIVLRRSSASRRYKQKQPAAPLLPAVGKQGFRIVSESQAYKRFLQVQDRRVAYPDGREIDFDIGERPAPVNAALRRCH